MPKKILIISPYFPPSNAADMQRIRMSLSYFEDFGWEAEVVTVDPAFSDTVKDELLLKSIPDHIKVHFVKALSKKWTSKLGLGSIALRSLPYFRSSVDNLLKKQHFDLIYFSTTQYPVCILGAHWQKKFKVPYVIDMQDPWHSDYYINKPKAERPPKYWFSYRLNKFLEPIAMHGVGGLISVSTAYIATLHERYQETRSIPSSVITFGSFAKDFEIVQQYGQSLKAPFAKENNKLNLVYIGRGGNDMQKALSKWFKAFKRGLTEHTEVFDRFRMFFIGTSYAPKGKGIPTIAPVAASLGLSDKVTEITDRIPFYEGLKSLQAADALIVPGSDDAGYTASKLYPYIQSQKPLLGLFHPQSSAVNIIETCNAGKVIKIDDDDELTYKIVSNFLTEVATNTYKIETDWGAFEPYTAKEMTKKQVELFEKVIVEA